MATADFDDEYTARLEGFPECFGSGGTLTEVRENFQRAIKRELGRSEKLAAQKLTIEIRSAISRYDKPDKKKVKMKKIGVRAKKDGDVFVGKVPVGVSIVIMPAKEAERGNKEMEYLDQFEISGFDPETNDVADGIARNIAGNLYQYRKLQNALEVVSKAIGSVMKIVELRRRTSGAVIEVIAKPLSLKGKTKALTTDPNGNLNDYVHVTTNRETYDPYRNYF